METATFGAGCFWGVQAAFEQIAGVKSTRVGYAGGDVPDPSYEEVCRGVTGQTEVVEVNYDPRVVSYDALLHIFFGTHNPTLPVTRQYRSVIFYHSIAQRDAAVNFKTQLEFAGIFSRAILTEILPDPVFYQAEEYHQHYEDKLRIHDDDWYELCDHRAA